MKTTFINICCLVGVLLFCNVASAKIIPICVKWRAEWTGTGYGEDRLVSSPEGPNLWTIDGLDIIAETLRQDAVTGKFVTELTQTWTLDENGCTEVFTVPNRYLRVTIPMAYHRSQNRNIRLLRINSTTWGQESDERSYIASDPYTWKIGNSDDTPETQTITIADNDIYRLMPVIHAFAKFANTLDWPANTSIHVAAGNGNLCDLDGPSYCKKDIIFDEETGHKIARICLNHVTGKGTLIHEIGHSINTLNAARMRGDYLADEKAAISRRDVCRGGGDYRLHSREWTGDAASEGFAEFLTHAVYIYRSRSTAEVHSEMMGSYYEPYPMGAEWYASSNIVDPTVPTSLSPSESTRWTALLCPPPSDFTRLGSTRDWIRFYWGIWAAENEDLRFEVSEINDLWETSLQTDRGLHTNCAPVTTTGEKGWTCVELPTKFPRTIAWTNGPVTVMWPTTKYHTGPSWEQFRDAAYVKYVEDFTSPDHNEAKYLSFILTGERAGVTY